MNRRERTEGFMHKHTSLFRTIALTLCFLLTGGEATFTGRRQRRRPNLFRS